MPFHVDIRGKMLSFKAKTDEAGGDEAFLWMMAADLVADLPQG